MRTTRFIYGFCGALIGSVLGIVSLFLLTVEAYGGNDIGVAFLFLYGFPYFTAIGAVLGILLSLWLLRYLRQEDQGGLLQTKKKRLKLALMLGVPVLIIGMPWVAWNRVQPPSDRELLSNFRRHQSDFERLANMTQTDQQLTRVDEDWTLPSDPQTIDVSPARISEYRRLSKSAETPRGFQTWGDSNHVEFYYYLTGSAISSGTFKGYAYLAKSPTQLLQSLDGCRPDEKNGVLAYRHIQGCWYLFYEYLPG